MAARSQQQPRRPAPSLTTSTAALVNAVLAASDLSICCCRNLVSWSCGEASAARSHQHNAQWTPFGAPDQCPRRLNALPTHLLQPARPGGAQHGVPVARCEIHGCQYVTGIEGGDQRSPRLGGATPPAGRNRLKLDTVYDYKWH